MTTQEIANQLVDYCRKGEYQKCYTELYSPEIESIEPKGANMEYTKGFEELQKKGEAWQSMVEEVHGSSVGDPIVAGNHFTCTMTLDMTMKGQGRQKMDELCVYEVKEGKVVKEQFFY